jgi:hypothetical protein
MAPANDISHAESFRFGDNDTVAARPVTTDAGDTELTADAGDDECESFCSPFINFAVVRRTMDAASFNVVFSPVPVDAMVGRFILRCFVLTQWLLDEDKRTAAESTPENCMMYSAVHEDRLFAFSEQRSSLLEVRGRCTRMV